MRVTIHGSIRTRRAVEAVMTRQLILGTAGHIDHGKTSLVRALTGVDTDRLPQEKKRGITIDIGFADLAVGDIHFGIIDVPGHERFVKNMLAGAVGIDVALLVVAADDSVMPQTREHLAIMQMLGIRRGVVALSKADAVESSWLDVVADDIRTLVSGTFLDGAVIVPTSAHTGVGLDALRQALLEAGLQTPQRTSTGPFRLAIDRSFVLEGRGTVVTGTACSGRVEVGDELQWLPSGKAVRVRRIQSHGDSIDVAGAGQRVALNLAGVHHREIQRGHELATPGTLESARRITVHLTALADSPRSIRHRSRIRLHIGSSEVMASVRLLRGTEILPGESAFAHIVCAQPVVSRCSQPFVVRSESPVATLGGGVVVQPESTRISRRDSVSIDRLDALLSDDHATRASAAVYFRGAREWSLGDLEREANLNATDAQRVVDRLTQDGTFVRVASGPDAAFRLHRDHFRDLSARIIWAIDVLHSASPLESSVPRSRLASELPYIDAGLLNGILHALSGEGSAKLIADGVALSSFEPPLNESQIVLCERVVQALHDAAFRPPPVRELASQLGASEAQLAPIIDLSISRGQLVNIGGGFFLHADHEVALRQRISRLLAQSEGLTLSAIKDDLNTSRKYAVPICEYLDRVGVTRRIGNLRKAGPHAIVGEPSAPKR
jgi:selenocysteine-specific elongation factor